ncbi:conjugation system SOS inhibitor PsiB, partial [Klebsiella pneumoniae]
PVWIIVFLTLLGQPVSFFRSISIYSTARIIPALSLSSLLDEDGYSFASIINTLKQEGEQ